MALALGFASGVRQPITAAAPLFLYSGLLVMMFAADIARVHRQRAVAITALALLLLPPALDAASSLVAPWVADRGRSDQLARGRRPGAISPTCSATAPAAGSNT